MQNTKKYYANAVFPIISFKKREQYVKILLI